MPILEDAKAAEAAVAQVVADCEPAGEVEYGTYVKTPTASGYVVELTKGEPPAPPVAAAPVDQAMA